MIYVATEPDEVRQEIFLYDSSKFMPASRIELDVSDLGYALSRARSTYAGSGKLNAISGFMSSRYYITNLRYGLHKDSLEYTTKAGLNRIVARLPSEAPESPYCTMKKLFTDLNIGTIFLVSRSLSNINIRQAYTFIVGDRATRITIKGSARFLTSSSASDVSNFDMVTYTYPAVGTVYGGEYTIKTSLSSGYAFLAGHEYPTVPGLDITFHPAYTSDYAMDSNFPATAESINLDYFLAYSRPDNAFIRHKISESSTGFTGLRPGTRPDVSFYANVKESQTVFM